MGKSKSRSASEGKHRSRRSATGEKVVEIMQQLPDGSYQPMYVSKERADEFEAEQERLRRAPKATDEDQFKLAEALGLGFTEDGRARCVPGYQYRGADGKCKARPVDGFTNTGTAQMTPIVYNDGYNTKALTTDGKIVNMGGGLGGISGFGNLSGGMSQYSAGAAPGMWGGGITPSRPSYSGFGSVPDPEDGQLKSYQFNDGTPWQKYTNKFLDINNCHPSNNRIRTPNNGCMDATDAFKRGITRAVLSDGTSVGMPPKLSYTDMTKAWPYRPYGQPAAKWARVPDEYITSKWEDDNGGAYRI